MTRQAWDYSSEVVRGDKVHLEELEDRRLEERCRQSSGDTVRSSKEDTRCLAGENVEIVRTTSYSYSLLVDYEGAQLDSDVFGKDTAQFDSARHWFKKKGKFERGTEMRHGVKVTKTRDDAVRFEWRTETKGRHGRIDRRARSNLDSFKGYVMRAMRRGRSGDRAKGGCRVAMEPSYMRRDAAQPMVYEFSEVAREIRAKRLIPYEAGARKLTHQCGTMSYSSDGRPVNLLGLLEVRGGLPSKAEQGRTADPLIFATSQTARQDYSSEVVGGQGASWGA
ncbi:hypothetical protein BJY52DRAFT_1223232 [Lactarius psammicola]|nr:hypothetical protein BJY52DRAFT_1223232 [Lactarius psammicola]